MQAPIGERIRCDIEHAHDDRPIRRIDDLTAPDALYTFSSPIQLPFAIEIPAFNLLPFLLAIAMYFQQKLMPKPKPNPNATDQQKQQQEMMQKAQMAQEAGVKKLVLVQLGPSLSAQDPFYNATLGMQSIYQGDIVFSEELLRIEL